MTAVRLAGVCFDYGGPRVLDQLELEVRSGELLAVLGASGSGKTTLLRLLAGFITPTSGQVTFGDRVIAGPNAWVPPERRRVGIVPQEGALFPHLDVAANIAFGLPRGSGDRVLAMLDLVGLPGMGARRPHELSGGQQQRVALARALAPEPEVICLDEPFTALDAGLRERLREEVGNILRATSTTAILVTHDQQEALALADRVAVLRDGRVAQVDEPRRLYQHPVDLELAHFIGNVVQVPAVMGPGGIATTGLGVVDVQAGPEPGTTGILILRPEQVRLDEAPAGARDAATVEATSFIGPACLVRVRLPSGESIAVRTPGWQHLPPGSLVTVEVLGAACLFIPGPEVPQPPPWRGSGLAGR